MVGAVRGPLTEGDPRRGGPEPTVGRLGAGRLGPREAADRDDGRSGGSTPARGAGASGWTPAGRAASAGPSLIG
mgnify:CR=1 FL=1